MVLEAVMVVVDNSESSRNGDYQPTRFDSQVDAVNITFQSITQGNPESSVGLMSMGGKGPEVLVTLTTEQGKILEGLHRTKKKIGGSSHLKTGIQVATLALKHRQNRSQRQRIIVFVCSPVEESEKELTTLAKKMKKANISVDFVLFGDLDDDSTKNKLQLFIDTVKTNDGCHLVVIPPSSKLLSAQICLKELNRLASSFSVLSQFTKPSTYQTPIPMQSQPSLYLLKTHCLLQLHPEHDSTVTDLHPQMFI
jgi:26S proteasome regulatory subunit N10